MKTYLITGGAGFIGSNFIHYLIKKYGTNICIINIDKLTYAGNLENITALQNNPNYHFFKIGIEDRATLEKNIFSNFKKIDVIVNFAAESHVDRSIMDSTEFIQTNIQGTQVLLDCSKAHKIPRYVQISTDEVYGSLSADAPAFTEQNMIEPNSPYAASKAAADLLVRSYIHTHKLPALITRCSNNYGPYQFPEKLIPLMISNALENKPLPVYGDGQNIRDWIFVEDHCSAVDTVIEKGKDGEIYNIGGNAELKNLDLVKEILRQLNKPESLITYVKDRPGHDRRYAMDFSHIKKTCGWQPKTNFKEGLKKTIEWYQNNQSWWQHIKSGEYQNYYNKQYDLK